MPESVTDRPTKSHSTVFLLSKSPRYFYDADAIREAFSGTWDDRGHRKTERHHEATPMLAGGLPKPAPRGPDGRRVTTVQGGENSEQHRNGERWPGTGANARSVWTIPTEPTPFAHFATWPQALVRRMVLAGTSEKGCCPECGAPWVREIAKPENPFPGSSHTHERDLEQGGTQTHASGKPAGTIMAQRWHAKGSGGLTVGWSQSCAHALEPVPCTVLDPFAGSATTMLVARNHGRHAVGIELNEAYLEIAAKRLQQLSLLTGTEA